MAAEREQLIGYLDLQRNAVISKLDGLTEEQARWKPAPTANSLLNLVVHLTGVERNWFQHVIAGKTIDRDRDAELRELTPDVTIASAIAGYRVASEESNAVMRSVDTDEPGRGMDQLNIRWVVLHMIEETARHAGHADITRELIDGTVEDS
ncbi:MAG: DinB family protein [Actinomycetota bacterium]